MTQDQSLASGNRQVVLASRPDGMPEAGNFRVVETPVPIAGVGEVLLRTIFLSLDPYMRGRMSAAKSYAAPVEIGGLMVGATVCEVMVSHHPDYAPGDIVLAYTGWQQFAVSDGQGLRKLDPGVAPVSTALGVLGMPGLTAYTGLLNIGRPQPGETVVVAAASGAVGSAVGQFARLKGARAVGIAGGPEKCAHVEDELGFDACVDHRAPGFAADLARACPAGIDVYFENVGGAVFDAVLPLLNQHARIPVCGLVAHYNAGESFAGPDRLPATMRAVLTRRIKVEGFIVWDFADREPEFLAEAGAWLRQGKLRYREDIVEGLENAPEALIGLLAGRNFGKLLVRVGVDP
jgi:NADPH-dependent curcumin reductase CurA